MLTAGGADASAPTLLDAGPGRPACEAAVAQAAGCAGPEKTYLGPLGLLPLPELDFHVGRWKWRGYFQADAANYDQAAAGSLETDFRRGEVGSGDAARARQLTDGALLRRARIGGEGTWGENIAYRVMFELGAGGVGGEQGLAEGWISYRRFAPFTIQAGFFPPPANMEESTNAESTLFLERATAAELSRRLGGGDGRLGLMVKRADKRWMAAVTLTGPLVNRSADYAPRAALVARVTRTLAETADESVHVGASATYVLQPAKAQDVSPMPGFPVRFANPPEVKVDEMSLIDTGEISARHANVVGLEFAAQRRNLFVQAEAFRFGVQRRPGDELADPHFFGWYVEGSWVLTGEHRRFDPARGAFWFPKPARPFRRGGWGAWELALRYSRMDLNYRPGSPGARPPPDGIRGGDQKILGLALEWYPQARTRVMFNYLRVSVDRLNPASPSNPEPFGPAPATPPIGVQIGQTLNVFAIRTRYAF